MIGHLEYHRNAKSVAPAATIAKFTSSHIQ